MIYLGMMTKENWASVIHGAQLQVGLKIQDERCYQGSSNDANWDIFKMCFCVVVVVFKQLEKKDIINIRAPAHSCVDWFSI